MSPSGPARINADAPSSAPEVQAQLGRPRLHLRQTDSTNERARELAIAGAPHGTLVTAAEQSAGRGRQGRVWSAPPGSSILMSLLLRSPPALLPLMAAVAVCDVVGERARIKWPNDIVVAADASAEPPALAKLAGILVEGRPQEGWAVLGIGVNVAVRLEELPAELQPGQETGARSAATMGLSRDQIEPLLARLLDALQRRLAESAEETLRAWRARDALRGREIAWNAGQGVADGIDGEGRLVVALDGGGHTALAAGEVHLQRIAPD
ncbi:MAG TPA: biotin--[acetyl-CoA-carboxylase] ligase [Solirubrobacteraceae bacterium]|nr:biotin--[acetyl-CoA-carboxylase] ligase [Solirubrobacteraceae bacterium]